MALVYITGIPGTGKSTVREELAKRGYKAYDTDDGLAAFYHNDSGKEVVRPTRASDRTRAWRAHHTWKISRDKVERLLAGSKDKTVFLCGTVSNDDEVRDLFSKVVALVVDEDTLMKRITSRSGDAFGKASHELEVAAQLVKTAEQDYRKSGAIIINGAQSVKSIADQILLAMSTDKRFSFDKAPEAYDKGRPGYPPQAFDDLFKFLGEQPEQTNVVEIAPGTGQATTSLLERGAKVTAIELGPHLADFMRDKFKSKDGLEIINSSFEDVKLPAESFDLVIAATAWHWFDKEIRVPKAVELLRPNGILATLSTIQIASEVDGGFFDRTFEIYRKHRPDEKQPKMPSESQATPEEYEEFKASGLLQNVTLKRYRWDQTYTSSEYEQLLNSYSDTQMMQPEARVALIRDLVAVIESEYGGRITRPLVVSLTMGRKQQKKA